MKHTLVTFITDIDAARRADLDSLLAHLETDAAGNALLPFRQMASIHYASFSIFPNESGKARDTLVFEINGDGDVGALVDELCEHGQKGLEAVFGGCEGFGSAPKNAAQMRAFHLSDVVMVPARSQP